MSTNQHLDALLIGALYGELSPAETAELDAHLLAHPADAGVLAQLRQTHATVRSGGFAQTLVEPPQAVSALLLQEAARKAPKKSLANHHEEKPGWFARFVRSFALHPAMAAAASLVLVAGIGGVLYMRGQGAVQNTAPALQQASEPPPAATGEADNDSAENLREQNTKLETIGAGLDDLRLEGKGLARGDLAKADPTAEEQTVSRRVATGTDKPAAPKKAKPYIPVSTTSAEPIAFDGYAKKPEPATTATNAISGGFKADDGDTRGGGLRDRAVGQADPNVASTPAAIAPTDTADDGPPAVKKATVKEAPSEAIVAPAPPPAKDSGKDAAWARGEHDKLKKLVVAGKCAEAAKVGAAMAARDPEYYQQFVANDRQVQGCAAYIREKRALESEKTSAGKPTKAPATTDTK